MQTLVQIQCHDVTAVIDTATGPKIVEPLGPRIPIQTVPTILTLPEDKVENTPNESDDVHSVEDIVKVQFEFEYEQFTKLGVKGSLKRNIEFWRAIGTPREILTLIKSGYQIPFTQMPPSVILQNNRSALMHLDFVEQAILELLQSDRVIEICEHAFVVNPLSVSVQATGKKRLILDLRHVNQYIVKAKLKYEDWKVGLKHFQKSLFMISFDLKSGYHHIEIHKNFQKFLGFSWKCSKTNKVLYFYRFALSGNLMPGSAHVCMI